MAYSKNRKMKHCAVSAQTISVFFSVVNALAIAQENAKANRSVAIFMSMFSTRGYH